MEEMTEPAVVPAEPDVKPKPSRETRPRPKKDDPWTVPAPKKDPTPKALNKNREEMKEMIDDMADYKAFSVLMTKEAFFRKYTLSMELTTKILAEKMDTYERFTDRSMTQGEKELMVSN